jgi:hypothetical protein
MGFEEIIKRIKEENLLIKEVFYTKRVIYEAVNYSGVRIFNLTHNQYKKILKTYLTSVIKEDYSGFVKRFYKIKF